MKRKISVSPDTLRRWLMVVEVPPKVLGPVNDMWYRWVIDVGITGPDKGEGGKYLFLPPGYRLAPRLEKQVALPP